jgi:hypothetical protein
LPKRINGLEHEKGIHKRKKVKRKKRSKEKRENRLIARTSKKRTSNICTNKDDENGS